MSRDKGESRKGINLSGNCCVICGWDKRNSKGELLVVGAHARPFRKISDYDRSDNIIGLCPNHHTEYDAGNFTIDPTNNQCIYVNQKDPFNLKGLVGRVDHVKQGYFDYHKKHIFQSKESR